MDGIHQGKAGSGAGGGRRAEVGAVSGANTNETRDGKAKAVRAAVTVMAVLTMGGCGSFNLSPQELMRSPRLGEQQAALENALLDAALGSEVRYTYPQTGEYRSAFVFQDLDMDGQEEALVFYTSSAAQEARLAILEQDAQRLWRLVFEQPGSQSDVAFLAFAHISGEERPDILVGWGGQGVWNRRQLGVYRYRQGRLENVLGELVDYDAYSIAQLGEAQRDCLILLTGDISTGDTQSRLQVYGQREGELELLDEARLATGIRSFAGVKVGKCLPEDRVNTIFIDEQRLDDMLYTEVFRWERTGLTPLVYAAMVRQDEGGRLSDDAVYESEPTLYEMTGRYESTVLCDDLDGDGCIEIPTEQVLPGYEERETAEKLWQVDYQRLADGAFLKVYSSITNQQGGYRIRLPEKWRDRVTVLEQPENNEWRLLEVREEDDGGTEDLSRELLRIRVVSSKDYQDKFTSAYTPLAVRGAFTYYGYLPQEAPEELQVSQQELMEMFTLI